MCFSESERRKCGSVLKRVLANTGLTYRFEGDIIVIREQLMNMNQQEEKKEITITGRVTDEKKDRFLEQQSC